MAKSWHLMPLQRAHADVLGRRLRLSPFLAQLLLNRGLAEPEQIEQFLIMPFRDLLDPEALPGTMAAADRACSAPIAAGWAIIIGRRE